MQASDLTDDEILDAQVIADSLAWAQKFYGSEIPIDAVLKEGEALSSVVASVSQEVERRLVFVLDLGGQPLSTFIETAEGQLLKAIIERGLNRSLQSICVLDIHAPNFIDLLQGQSPSAVMVLGCAVAEKFCNLANVELEDYKWKTLEVSKYISLPGLDSVLADANVKKVFWETIRPLKK